MACPGTIIFLAPYSPKIEARGRNEVFSKSIHSHGKRPLPESKTRQTRQPQTPVAEEPIAGRAACPKSNPSCVKSAVPKEEQIDSRQGNLAASDAS